MMRISGAKANRIETIAFFKEIANRMFIPEDTVEAIWAISTDIITEALIKNEQVTIRRFGVFYLNNRGRIRFRTASSLRQTIKEHTMEKYGVEINNEAILMAKVTGECPDCKQPLISKDPPQCNNCGTRPFEKRKQLEEGPVEAFMHGVQSYEKG